MSKTNPTIRVPSNGPAGLFPAGLRDVTLTVRFPKSILDLAGVVGALRARPGFSTRTDKGGVRGALRGSKGWGSVHAHITVERQTADEHVLEFELTSRKHGTFQAGTPTVAQFIKIIGGALGEAAPFNAIIGAHYSLPMDRWAPTVPLPFIPPGTLDHLPGAPQISGLDFSFTEPGLDQPLIRAFVTTYDHLSQMVVRILLARAVVFDTQLPEYLIESSQAFLPRFAQERETDV